MQLNTIPSSNALKFVLNLDVDPKSKANKNKELIFQVNFSYHKSQNLQLV